MHTARLLTVYPSKHCRGGSALGVSARGGGRGLRGAFVGVDPLAFFTVDIGQEKIGRRRLPCTGLSPRPVSESATFINYVCLFTKICLFVEDQFGVQRMKKVQ